MRLDGILSQAASGLDSIQRKLASVAQNVANANTPDYVRETVSATSVTSEGIGGGVRTGPATRSVDAALQGDLFAADAEVADNDVRQTALSAIDQAQGAPGSAQDLASLVGALRDGFSTLATDPSNQTQQRAVLNQATALAGGINTLSTAIGNARQTVHDQLLDDVTQVNTALSSIGQLSDQIIAARGRNEGSADLEDRRDTELRTVAQLTGARFVTQSNGDILAVSGGTVLPTRAATGPLALSAATLSAGSTAPALTVAGRAAPIAGGRIGGELALRDTILPAAQTDADSFAQALATGFQGAGLTLFTGSAGVVPPPGTAGFAQSIQVSAAVTATPSQLRDGTAAAGAAGSTTLIDTVLASVLNGGSGTIAGQAATLVAGNAQTAANAAGTFSANQAVQASLTKKLAAGTGVSVDSELSTMVQLQNSYGANAKVIAAVQSMWTQLLGTIQ